MNNEALVNRLTLALGIALLPPLWAVFAPYIGVNTGAVALICAGVYVAFGNKPNSILMMCIGFLCGNVWSVIAMKLMEVLTLPVSLRLFVILFVLGGIAVIIGDRFSKYIFLPAWLCGWAIGMTILSQYSFDQFGTLPLQIAVSMVVGVVYVGYGVDKFQKLLLKWCGKNE